MIQDFDIHANVLVGIIMGSTSDLETMQAAADTLTSLEISFEMRVVSAHRTPDLLFEYAESAEARGLEVLIAGAGGAAHLPGMAAAKTALPVLGVPVQSKALDGMDSLLSMVQMPAGEFPYLSEMFLEHVLQPGYAYADEFEVGLELVLNSLERLRDAH